MTNAVPLLLRINIGMQNNLTERRCLLHRRMSGFERVTHVFHGNRKRMMTVIRRQ